MMNLAGSRYPRVILASPVLQPPRRRHSCTNSGPAARWIAPSTPPPPSSDEFAALTMASTARVVMSARRISIMSRLVQFDERAADLAAAGDAVDDVCLVAPAHGASHGL